jgi:hypothetical protein
MDMPILGIVGGMKLHRILWFVFLIFLIISIVVEIGVFSIFRSEGLSLEKYEAIKPGENPAISTVLIRELFRISHGEIGFIVFSLFFDLSIILLLDILGNDSQKEGKVFSNRHPESPQNNPTAGCCDDSNRSIFPPKFVCPECECQIEISSEKQPSLSTICPKCLTEIKIYEVKEMK